MQDPRNLSWNQFNQVRKFPLLFDCSAISRDGHFSIPDDLITGLYLSYGLGRDLDDPGGFYIGEMIYWRTGLSISIHYKPTGQETGTKIAETTIDLTGDITAETASLLGFRDRFFYGTIIFGSTAGLEKQPAGQWFFDSDAAAIDPFCIRPTAREVSALYVQSGGTSVGPFYGDITLVAGDRISLAVRSADSVLHCLDDPPSSHGTEIVIAAEADSTEAGGGSEVVKTINGVTPDENGNITLTGRSCLDISTLTDQAAIVLDDTCAQPCCTCKELEPVKAKMETLLQSISDLEDHIETLTLQAEFLSQSIGSIR